jgi:hypothetical protein
MIILIAGAKSNSGKTTLVRILLTTFKGRFSALKITPSTHYGEGVLGYKQKEGLFSCIKEDENKLYEEGKDTYFFIKDGAKSVFWVRGEKAKLKELLDCTLKEAEGDLLVEGNSFIDYKEPDLMFFTQNETETPKENALLLKNRADIIVVNTLSNNYIYNKDTIIVNLQYALKDCEHPFRLDLIKIVKDKLYSIRSSI